MGVGHGHGQVTATGSHRRVLAIVLGLTGLALVVELVGAYASGSLALLTDAVHMAGDAGGIALALFAATLAGRPPTARRTFGWQRAEVLAAAVNGLVLLALAVYLLIEGARRLLAPTEVASGTMLAVAVLGLLTNGVALALLRRGQAESLNVRGAYVEVLGDLLGSAAVVVAAAVIALTGWTRADAVASVAITALIVPRALGLLRQALHVLLEGTPAGVDLDHVRAHILAVPGVIDVHDLHAWTITSGLPVLSAHVVVESGLASGADAWCGGAVLDQLTDCLAHHFDVAHSTFQLEPERHRAHEQARCD
jgi:cobalt-zinc-cadmium efflux system protein